MAEAPDETDETTEAERESDRLKAVHERAMKRFDDAAWPQQELRALSLKARRFVAIPGAQWEDEWGDQFQNSIKVESNKVSRGLRKIENDYRENRIVPEFRPDGDNANDETAETLAGLHRADSYRFKSQQARDNAAFEAFAGGFGAYRLSNEWDDETDKDNDHQRINPASIIVDADQSVFFDPNARLYDKSDARWAFIRTAMTKDAFADEYGDDAVSNFPDGVGWKVRDWFTAETCAVAEYYEKEEKSEALWICTYTISGEEKRIWSSDLEPGDLSAMRADGWQTRKQNRKRSRVHKYVLSGAEVLEDRGYIAGDQIPIVPVYGQRYYVDNIERWKGYVQDKMDSQRLYNSQISRLAEVSSLSPREIPIFDPTQMDPIMADQWARANIDRLPFLTAHALRNEDGSIAQAGPIGKLSPAQLEPVTAALLQIANQDLLEDMEDGADTAKANTSADAMDIAATRIDAKSGAYLDSFRQSVQYEGEIYKSMAAEVYGEKGRKVSTMTEDGNDGQAELKQMTGDGKIVNDFSGARYKVIASVTEATATRRDKTVRQMLNVADTATQMQDMDLAQAALLTAVLNQDGEGIDDFHDYCRQKALAIGLVKPTDEEAQQMQEAAQNQQPDPTADALQAQAKDFEASAREKETRAIKNIADAKLKGAQTAETLASAGAKHAQAVDTFAGARDRHLKTRADILRPMFGGAREAK